MQSRTCLLEVAHEAHDLRDGHRVRQPEESLELTCGDQEEGRRSEHHGELTTLSYVVSVVASIVMSAMLSFVMSAVVRVTVSAVVSTRSVGWGLRHARGREGRLTIGMQFGGELLT